MKFLNLKLATFLSIFSLIIILSSYSLLPKVDWPNYYNFADKRFFWGTPCAFDVWSNLIYLIGGLIGFNLSFKNFKKNHQNPFWFYLFFLSLSITLTSLGSAYFHLHPNLITIFWDRIPMVFVFSAVIGLIFNDKYGSASGIIILALMVIIGILSLLLWKYNYIDLRLYFIIQYGGISVFLIQVLFNPSGNINNLKLGLVLASYLIAKILEINDQKIFYMTHFISGHTLKHLVSGVGIIALIKLIPLRETIPNQNTPL